MNLSDFTLDPAATSAPPHFELSPNELPRPTDASAIVREALIPFVFWPDVPVRVLEPRNLGRLELFLLEAGLALGYFDFAELQMATDVPVHLIAAIAGKLLRQGAIVQFVPGQYAVDETKARQMLAAKVILEEQNRAMRFVYFPRQDLVIADQDITQQLLDANKKIYAPAQAPFRPEVDRKAGVAEFIESRIHENRVFGFAHPLVGVNPWPKAPPWPKEAPCYYGRGYVKGVGEGAEADIQIWGRPKKRAKALSQYQGEKVLLKSVTPLLAEWISLAGSFRSHFRGMVSGLPSVFMTMQELANGEWRLGVAHEGAKELASDRWLTETYPISICSPTVKVDIRVSFEPMDVHAARLFALDFVAKRVDVQKAPHSERELSESIRLAHQRYPQAAWLPFRRSDVEERLWNLKRFVAIYKERAIEDFSYA